MENQENKKLTRKEKKALRKQKRSSADKKGVLLVVALSVVALALLVNAVSLYNEGSVIDETEKSTTQDVVVTLPSTTGTTIPVQTTIPTVTEKDPEQTTENTTDIQDPKQEILDKVAFGVNSLKNEKGTIKAVKTQTISLKLTECSLPAFVGVVNTVLDFFAGETVTEYTCSNGIGTDSKGNEIELKNSIPPTNNETKEFNLTIDGLADAWTTEDGENTVYTIVVVPESSTMADPRPPYHNSAGDTFDCTKVELPIGKITKADFDYPGSEISVTLNPQGKIVRYHQVLKINGIGQGAAMGMSASGRIEGNAVETWDITY
jgi:hypothetical protein